MSTHHLRVMAPLFVLAACFGDDDKFVAASAPFQPAPSAMMTIRLLGAAELVVGDQSGLKAERRGPPDVAPLRVSWTSSDSQVLRIIPRTCVASSDCSDIVEMTALAAGTATITGVSDAGSASATFTIRALHAAQAFIWLGQEMIAIDPLPATVASWATAINDADQIVGYASTEGMAATVTHAFMWSAASGGVDIGVLPGDVSSGATAISANGQVVGWSESASGSRRGFVWSAAAGLRMLPTPPGAQSVVPTGVSANGDVVGSVAGASFAGAYRWPAARPSGPLFTPVANVSSGATAISDDGTTAGWMAFGNSYDAQLAIVWGAGVSDSLRQVSPICGDPAASMDCENSAVSISRSGKFLAVNGASGAFVSSATGGFVTLPRPRDAGYGFTLSGVNDSGAASVNTRVSVVTNRAGVWQSAIGLLDLSPPIGRHVVVSAGINNAGHIAGYTQ